MKKFGSLMACKKKQLHRTASALRPSQRGDENHRAEFSSEFQFMQQSRKALKTTFKPIKALPGLQWYLPAAGICRDLQAPSGWFGTFLFEEGNGEDPWEDDCDQQNADLQQLQLLDTKVLVSCHIVVRPIWLGLTLNNSFSLGCCLRVKSTIIRVIANVATIIQPQLTTRSTCNRSRASVLRPRSPSIRSSAELSKTEFFRS